MEKKEIKVEELKKIQIGILDYVDDFCKKNNINYWIDTGTLLGAVRHKGYIPWDDDIDIGMLREDYDRFIKLYDNNKDEYYKFYCYENNKDWSFSFGKVLDTRTVLYEPNEEMGIKISVYIDVFVYDNIPENIRKQKMMYKRRNLFLKLNVGQLFKKSIDPKKEKYNFLRYPLYYILNLFPKSYFVKKNIENCKKYYNIKTNYVGNFTSKSVIVCNKKIFDSFIELEFEGKKYPAPIGYDEWLKAFYGNYMELPPKEKQISNHKFVSYYK